MKFLKRMIEYLRTYFARNKSHASDVDFDIYLREKVFREAREREHMKYKLYGRVGWL